MIRLLTPVHRTHAMLPGMWSHLSQLSTGFRQVCTRTGETLGKLTEREWSGELNRPFASGSAR